MALYHYQIGFPPSLKIGNGIVPLRYSRHAIEAAKTDRYGMIILPDSLDTSKALLVELEVDGHCVSKAVYRIGCTPTTDLILVIIPEKGFGFVKTVWQNLKSDKHTTLRRHLYKVP